MFPNYRDFKFHFVMIPEYENPYAQTFQDVEWEPSNTTSHSMTMPSLISVGSFSYVLT